MKNRDTDAILEYHGATKHSEWSVRTSRHVLDFENPRGSEWPLVPKGYLSVRQENLEEEDAMNGS